MKRIVFLLLPLFAFILLACDGDTETVSEKDKEAFQKPYSVGETVTNGSVEWVVLEAVDLGSTLKATSAYSEDCVSSSGKYIKATVKIKNNANEMRSVSDLPLYDDKERRFVSASGVYNCVDDDVMFLFDNINPGLEETFTSVYEIPLDAQGLALRTSDLTLFGSDYKYISLGLD